MFPNTRKNYFHLRKSKHISSTWIGQNILATTLQWKKCRFCQVELTRNAIKNEFFKKEFIYNGFGLAFYGAGSQRFGYEFVAFFFFFFLIYNKKNNFMVLGKGLTDVISNIVVELECLSLHHNSEESYIYVKKNRDL